jgi:hypothetical protein
MNLLLVLCASEQMAAHLGELSVLAHGEGEAIEELILGVVGLGQASLELLLLLQQRLADFSAQSEVGFEGGEGTGRVCERGRGQATAFREEAVKAIGRASREAHRRRPWAARGALTRSWSSRVWLRAL